MCKVNIAYYSLFNFDFKPIADSSVSPVHRYVYAFMAESFGLAEVSRPVKTALQKELK